MVRGSASIQVLNEGQTMNLFPSQPAQGSSGAAPTTRWCLHCVMEASEWLPHLSVTTAASSLLAQTLIRLGIRKNITERVLRHGSRLAGMLCNHRPWKCSESVRMRHLGTWLCGEGGSAGVVSPLGQQRRWH